MCDIDWELEPWTFSRQTTHKARKEHDCDCCHRKISPGETYRVLVTMGGGDFTREKECAECMAMVNEFRREHATYSSPSYMPDMVRDCIEWEEDDEVKAKWQREIDRIEAVSA